MTLFSTFVRSSVPLDVEKEEQAIKDCIYREEADEGEVIVTTISPKRYGKSYNMLENMGYQGHRSLTGNTKALVKPLSHTQGHDTQDTAGLGFGLENDIPTFDQNAVISSESKDDDPPSVATTLQDEEFMPITSLL